MSYSSWKFEHHQGFINEIIDGENKSPLRLILILTNKCTGKCHFCVDKAKNEKYAESLEFNTVIALLKQAKDMGVKSIEFTGGGEPTEHPKFEEIFSYAKRLGFDIGIITNGLNLPRIGLDILNDIEWIRVSINAYSDEVFRNVCGRKMNYRKQLEGCIIHSY